MAGLIFLSHPVNESPEKWSCETNARSLWTPADAFEGWMLAEIESEIFATMMVILFLVILSFPLNGLCLYQSLIARDGNFRMASLWKSGMPAMKLINFQFDRCELSRQYCQIAMAANANHRLLMWNYPRLHDHFRDIRFLPEVKLCHVFLKHEDKMILSLFRYWCRSGFLRFLHTRLVLVLRAIDLV